MYLHHLRSNGDLSRFSNTSSFLLYWTKSVGLDSIWRPNSLTSSSVWHWRCLTACKTHNCTCIAPTHIPLQYRVIRYHFNSNWFVANNSRIYGVYAALLRVSIHILQNVSCLKCPHYTDSRGVHCTKHVPVTTLTLLFSSRVPSEYWFPCVPYLYKRRHFSCWCGATVISFVDGSRKVSRCTNSLPCSGFFSRCDLGHLDPCSPRWHCLIALESIFMLFRLQLVSKAWRSIV